MSGFDQGNFYCGTIVEWTSCPRPARRPDHTSPSGLAYWYGDAGVTRYSDHWGGEVASCDWYLDGVRRCSFDDQAGWRCGFASWNAFVLKPFEVTVYSPGLLPPEALDRLGAPMRTGIAPAWRPGLVDEEYATYRVRPDMIVGGCVVGAGEYGDCGTPFDGRQYMSVDVSDWTEDERASWTDPHADGPDGSFLPCMSDDAHGRCR